MKNILVLGGGSAHNKDWVNQCVSFLKEGGEEPVAIFYDHWESGEKNIDFDTETNKIKALVEGAVSGTEWIIFAKSIGSILSLKAISTGVINPTKCVFFGMPLNIAEDLLEGNWGLLKNLSIPSLAFHNEADPTADYKFTMDILSKHAPEIKIVTKKGDNHIYLDFFDYNEEISNFLN